MIDWNSSGRLFHSLWPLKVNARWPAAVLQSGICRRSLFLVLQLCTSDLVLNFWQRYGGASPFKHLNTMVASLTSSCLTIGSHCNCLRIGYQKINARGCLLDNDAMTPLQCPVEYIWMSTDINLMVLNFGFRLCTCVTEQFVAILIECS